MPDPSWPSSPPEANYLRLRGPGAAGTASTLASGAAWQAMMGSGELGFSLSTSNTAATALSFQGAGGSSSAGTAAGLNTALQLLAGWAQEKMPVAASAAAAYETAVSAMIPAEVSLANRAQQASDVALNPLVLGALTPAIVALDTAYFGEHWPHNAGAGAAYGSALTALLPALAVPPPIAPQGGSPAAPLTAAAAVAETAGQTAAGETLKESGQAAKLASDSAAAPAQVIGQAASMLTQPLQSSMGALQPMVGMFQAPMQALQGLSGLSQSMLGRQSELAEAASSNLGQAAPGLLATAGTGSGAIGAVGAGTGAVSAGAVGAGSSGSIPGAGLTSYTRPTGSFAPEGSGRPVGLKAGLLSAADLRGPTTSPGGAPVPITRGPVGMLGSGKDPSNSSDGPRARVVLSGGHPPSVSSS